MNMKKKFYIITVLLSVSFQAVSQKTILSYPDLVKRLYDLEYLATPPQPGEKSGNFSSFDRKSSFDPTTNTYVNWEANGDGNGYIRKEGNDIVVFESDGPGVIWRFWSALADTGHIKIFIDNSTSPAINIPFRDFFEKFSNGIPPMNFPNLVMTLSRGRNSFLPVPYNKHCKIVFEKNWGSYYHITYTTFPKNTILPVFTAAYENEDYFALAEADRHLSKRGYERKIYKGEVTDKIKIKARPNDHGPAKTIMGNRAITQLKINYDPSKYSTPESREGLFKNLWISITWDQDSKPAVFAPIGLFFGTSAGNNNYYRSYPIGALEGTLYSNWFMPFSEKASIRVTNKSKQEQDLELVIIHSPLPASPGKLLRFHAKWHNGLFLDSVRTKGRKIDWPLLLAKGPGRYCGLSLHVKNEWEEPAVKAKEWWYGLWNRKTIDWWWGEGDEKFFVDGEKFPSTFGTGSEDYIGYAWSAEPPFPTFESPFASQPETPLTGNGNTIVNRFHIADNIPFVDSFEGVIEKYKPDRWGEKKTNVCEYETVIYWYLGAGLADNY